MLNSICCVIFQEWIRPGSHRWPRMSCRIRIRLTSSVVICLALTYIVLFNGLALYSLTKSTYTPASVPVNRGRLYFAYLGFNTWKCKIPHFAKQPLPLTALASFPGSGNTWVRHILQQATGKTVKWKKKSCISLLKIQH